MIHLNMNFFETDWTDGSDWIMIYFVCESRIRAYFVPSAEGVDKYGEVKQ